MNRITARHGTPVAGLEPLGLTHTFPTAAELAKADLDGLGLTTARTATIQRFSQAVDADEIRLDRSVGLDDLVASINAVKGLGPWTAHYLALRLGERDAFPESDLDLRNAMVPGSTVSTADVRAAAEPWRPWRGGRGHAPVDARPPRGAGAHRGTRARVRQLGLFEGTALAVDSTFATATRTHLDERSWIDVMPNGSRAATSSFSAC